MLPQCPGRLRPETAYACTRAVVSTDVHLEARLTLDFFPFPLETVFQSCIYVPEWRPWARRGTLYIPENITLKMAVFFSKSYLPRRTEAF